MLEKTTTKLCKCGKQKLKGRRKCKQCILKLEREKVKKIKRQIKKKEKSEVSIGTLDGLWRKAVKLVYGDTCDICGRSEYINIHHFFSRSNTRLRWFVPNGIVLCAKHHNFDHYISAHKAPAEFVDFIKRKRGDEWYHIILTKNQEQGQKVDKKRTREILLSVIQNASIK